MVKYWFAAGLLEACVAHASPLYSVIDLGPSSGAVKGINDGGQVVGFYTPPTAPFHAMLYSAGSMTDLGTLGAANGGYSAAESINGSGQVVGLSSIADTTHAFLYTNGTMLDLGTLGGTYSAAQGINDSGQVVGTSSLFGQDVAQNAFAFLYTNGSMFNLGTLGGDNSRATGINNSGQVSGYSEINNGSVQHAFLYTNGGMLDLGTLGGESSYGFGINNLGQVVGRSYAAGAGGSKGFLYSSGSMIDLGNLGGDHVDAFSINDSGQVVGYSHTADHSTHAFLYSNGSMTDLNSLLDPLSGWTVTIAYDINSWGDIAAEGYNPKFGNRDLLLLSSADHSVPEPGSLELLGAAGIALCVHRRRQIGTSGP